MRKIIAILATIALFVASVLGVSAFNTLSELSAASLQVLQGPVVGEFSGRVTQVDVGQMMVMAAGTVRFSEAPPLLIAKDLPAQIGLSYERTSTGRARLTGQGLLVFRVVLPSGRPVNLTARLRDLVVHVERLELGIEVSVPLISDEIWGPIGGTADPGRATIDQMSTNFYATMDATLERFLDRTIEPGDILTELAMTDLPSPTPGEGGPNPDEPGGGGEGDPPIATPRGPNS